MECLTLAFCLQQCKAKKLAVLSIEANENNRELNLNRPTQVTPGVTPSVKPVFVLGWEVRVGPGPVGLYRCETRQ